MSMRVYELAKKLGIENRDLLPELKKMGVTVASHSSALDASIVQKVLEKLAPRNKGPARRSSASGPLMLRNPERKRSPLRSQRSRTSGASLLNGKGKTNRLRSSPNLRTVRLKMRQWPLPQVFSTRCPLLHPLHWSGKWPSLLLWNHRLRLTLLRCSILLRSPPMNPSSLRLSLLRVPRRLSSRSRRRKRVWPSKLSKLKALKTS